jgi:hypothetical protein
MYWPLSKNLLGSPVSYLKFLTLGAIWKRPGHTALPHLWFHCHWRAARSIPTGTDHLSSAASAHLSSMWFCVCVFLAKSLLPTPEVNDMQDHPGKMFDITLILTWYYCPVKPRPNHPDISKHIQTIQFHAIRTLSWTSSKHQCPTCCNYGTVASNLEKPMTQSKEWTSGLAGRLASANDTSFL